MTGYFTVVIPFAPKPYRTEWHPTDDVGPFSTLTRGSFDTIAEAIEWAKANLNGTPYSIVLHV